MQPPISFYAHPQTRCRFGLLCHVFSLIVLKCVPLHSERLKARNKKLPGTLEACQHVFIRIVLIQRTGFAQTILLALIIPTHTLVTMSQHCLFAGKSFAIQKFLVFLAAPKFSYGKSHFRSYQNKKQDTNTADRPVSVPFLICLRVANPGHFLFKF